MPVRIWSYVFLGLFALGTVGCDQRGTVTDANSGKTAAPVEIGEPLYTPKPWPTLPPPGSVMSDALVVPNCLLIVQQKQDVPSQTDGVVDVLGYELKDGENPPPGVETIPSPRDPNRKFAMLKEGDRVKEGQLVAVLDWRRAKATVDRKAAAVQAAKEEALAAENTHKATLANLAMARQAGTATSPLERLKAEVEVSRALAEKEAKKAQIIVAEAEYKEALVLLEQFEIRATISGIIQKVYRYRGESVKGLEPVMLINSTDKLRVEGQVDLQYRDRFVPGMKVRIEATRDQAPFRRLIGHTQAVTAVAVSKQKPAPLVLSAGEDRQILVWYRLTQVRSLPHPTAVRSLDVGEWSKSHFALSGADDGKWRIWELGTPDKQAEMVGKAPREATDADRHNAPIYCVRFSPDSKTFATACEREVRIWETETGKLKYKLPPELRGQTTALQFLPQAKLMTVGRDNTLRIWALGQNGAKLEMTIDRRSGDVAQLGVSPDGKYALYDQGKSLRVLTLPEKRTEGVLQATSASSKFNTLALFSPDGKYILAAGGGDGRLQLWRSPLGGARPTELAQWSSGDIAPVTSAAFGTADQLGNDGSKAGDIDFAVTGSASGTVYVWSVPSVAELDTPFEAVVTNVESVADASRQVRVTAELDNTKANLLPGTAVTIVVNPVGVPAAK